MSVNFSEVYRHSMAHILAKAVVEMFGAENVQLAIGPQIDEGFYYDFQLPRSLNQDDFKTIEDKMREILKRREDFKYVELSREEALERFKDQEFKVELINDLPEGEKISMYYTGDDFVDLCRGPHVDNAAELMSCAYKVKSVSSAYWRGDETKAVLQRVYVFCFETKEELKAHPKKYPEQLKGDSFFSQLNHTTQFRNKLSHPVVGYSGFYNRHIILQSYDILLTYLLYTFYYMALSNYPFKNLVS